MTKGRSIRTVKKPRRGRPVGRVALTADPSRFEVALFLVATEIHGMRPYAAAYLVALACSDNPIDVCAIDEEILRLSTDVGYATAKGRTGALVRKVHSLRLTALEIDWLATSTAHLQILVSAESKSAAVTAHAIDQLIAHGWRDILQRLFERMESVAASNHPPVEEKLSRNSARLIDDLRSRLKNLNHLS